MADKAPGYLSQGIQDWWNKNTLSAESKQFFTEQALRETGYNLKEAEIFLRTKHPTQDDFLYYFPLTKSGQDPYFAWGELQQVWQNAKDNPDRQRAFTQEMYNQVNMEMTKPGSARLTEAAIKLARYLNKMPIRPLSKKNLEIDAPVVQLPEAGPEIPTALEIDPNVQPPQIPYSSEAGLLVPQPPKQPSSAPPPDYSRVGVPLLNGEMYLIDHSRKPFDLILQTNFRGSGRIDPFLKVK